jgi:hypothetical protein
LDSRSQRSSPTCFTRGIDGGKNIKGIKLHVVCDKHGSLIDLEVTPANHDDRASALPILPRLAKLGFQGDLLGDNGYKGQPFADLVSFPGARLSCRSDLAYAEAGCRIRSGSQGTGPASGILSRAPR